MTDLVAEARFEAEYGNHACRDLLRALAARVEDLQNRSHVDACALVQSPAGAPCDCADVGRAQQKRIAELEAALSASQDREREPGTHCSDHKPPAAVCNYCGGAGFVTYPTHRGTEYPCPSCRGIQQPPQQDGGSKKD